MEDALAALKRLKNDPGLYRAMVQNGRARASSTPRRDRGTVARSAGQRDRERICEMVEHAQGGSMGKRPLRQAARLALHKLERERFWKAIGGRGYQAAGRVQA